MFCKKLFIITLVFSTVNAEVKGTIPGVGDLLWDNTNIMVGTAGLTSIQANNEPVGANQVNAADDFVIPTGEVWRVDFVYSTGALLSGVRAPDAFGVSFYNDDAGKPGTLISAEEIFLGGSVTASIQELSLVNAVILEEGRYWVSVYGIYEEFKALSSERWLWIHGNSAIGVDAHIQDTLGIAGGFTWSTCIEIGTNCLSLNYALRGSLDSDLIFANGFE